MKKRNGGFTLMELMIVIAIIIILAGAIVARISTTGERAKEAKARSDVEQIASACRAFYMDTGLWPINIAALVTNATPAQGYNENHVATNLPAGSFKGPYLEVATIGVVPNDPWGEQYSIAYDNRAAPGTWLFLVRCGPTHQVINVLVHRFSA